MGSGASLEPKSFGAPEAEPLERQQYIEEHHVMWDAFTNGDMEEVYKHAASQSSAGALAALGPANFQNCLRMSVAGIGKTQPHPKNVEEAVAVLCRGVALAQWPMAKVGMFTTDHPRQWEVLRGCLRAMQSASEELTAEKAAEKLLESLDDGEESRHFAALVLLVARDCVAGDLQDKALELVGKYLKLHKPTDPYQAGDLLALWYALQWRQKKEEPKWVGKMAVMPFKESHVKIFVDDSKTPMDLGVSSWDEADLKEGTLPEILRDWKVYGDAMAWLTKGEIGIEAMVVLDCWDFKQEHFRPMWDSKYKRCISQPTNLDTKELREKMMKWEEAYRGDKDSDVVGFHILGPASKHPEGKVDVCVGGIRTDTIRNPFFKGRPCYLDEGLDWAHHNRVFWCFHETHHKYERFYQDHLDFAQLIKKTDHPMFVQENWMEEFLGGNKEFFPNEDWKGKNEFDWYVQTITKRLADAKEPLTLVDGWKLWWGGNAPDVEGKHFDFESEHHKLWDAGASKDWEKVLELTDSQLRPMCARKLGKSNYKTVVILAVRALAHTDKPVQTIVQTLKKGMKVLGWPSERAKELVSQIPAEKEEPVLKAFAEEKDTEDAPPEPKKPAISIIEDHHEMWDAYQDKDWEEVMDHVATQVSAKALARLGEANFQNCIRLAMGAIAHSKEEPEDVEKAVEVMKEGLSIAQWESEKIGEYNLLSLHPKAEEVLKAL
ncbi:unnamed protein product [Effrenium voratum]|uniref:Uncharacterized protein n=1 Tax=Effrenium voratum TaxID=2562239 RepID=A0AA36HN04_9DINO|nr:unnamed protein product [Effrenium voratum]CAJ1424333.1 unnamed protein product [Effrenium voratum]